jgi:hypothetical protein
MLTSLSQTTWHQILHTWSDKCHLETIVSIATWRKFWISVFKHPVAPMGSFFNWGLCDSLSIYIYIYVCYWCRIPYRLSTVFNILVAFIRGLFNNTHRLPCCVALTCQFWVPNQDYGKAKYQFLAHTFNCLRVLIFMCDFVHRLLQGFRSCSGPGCGMYIPVF